MKYFANRDAVLIVDGESVDTIDSDDAPFAIAESILSNGPAVLIAALEVHLAKSDAEVGL